MAQGAENTRNGFFLQDAKKMNLSLKIQQGNNFLQDTKKINFYISRNTSWVMLDGGIVLS